MYVFRVKITKKMRSTEGQKKFNFLLSSKFKSHFHRHTKLKTNHYYEWVHFCYTLVKHSPRDNISLHFTTEWTNNHFENHISIPGDWRRGSQQRESQRDGMQQIGTWRYRTNFTFIEFKYDFDCRICWNKAKAARKCVHVPTCVILFAGMNRPTTSAVYTEFIRHWRSVTICIAFIQSENEIDDDGKYHRWCRRLSPEELRAPKNRDASSAFMSDVRGSQVGRVCLCTICGAMHVITIIAITSDHVTVSPTTARTHTHETIFPPWNKCALPW